jgi:hypothetical protein
MAAVDQSMASKILNALMPTGTAGAPGTMIPALSALAMKLRLASGTSSPSAAGTELTGTGYTTGGTSFSTASTASSAGSAVTCPHTTPISWTNGSGSAWSIQSLDITDGAALRVFFGQWNGAPISVANGNTFQVAAEAITVTCT